jgi:CheY-like chemotaxis protein
MKKTQTAPKVIVIIDDDLWVLEAMSGLLKSWGHQVVSADTDDAALDQLAETRQRPDLIICDYRLADGRIGIDAIERMRKAFGPPAFLITAEAAPPPLAESGARQYLMLNKPVDPTTLHAMVSQALEIGDIPHEHYATGLRPTLAL